MMHYVARLRPVDPERRRFQLAVVRTDEDGVDTLVYPLTQSQQEWAGKRSQCLAYAKQIKERDERARSLLATAIEEVAL